MMETDDEQVEKLKEWWKENGRAVIAGVVIGVGGLFGYRGWIDWQQSVAEEASSHFSQMITAVKSNENEAVAKHAGILIADYGSTDYAMMARLALAKRFVETEEYEKAAAEFKAIISDAGDNPLGLLARKRLATVYIQKSDFDQALKVLEADFSTEFAAAVEELKGDVYAKQGNTSQAADAYRKAQRSSPGPADSEFLQQKLDDLGVTS